MSAAKIRQRILEDATEIWDEALQRSRLDIDPLTGAEWTGDGRTFNKLLDAVIKLAVSADDTVRLPGYNKSMSPLEAMDRLLADMFSGEITPQECRAACEPLLSLLNAEDMLEAQDNLDAIDDEMKAMEQEVRNATLN